MRLVIRLSKVVQRLHQTQVLNRSFSSTTGQAVQPVRHFNRSDKVNLAVQGQVSFAVKQDSNSGGLLADRHIFSLYVIKIFSSFSSIYTLSSLYVYLYGTCLDHLFIRSNYRHSDCHAHTRPPRLLCLTGWLPDAIYAISQTRNTVVCTFFFFGKSVLVLILQYMTGVRILGWRLGWMIQPLCSTSSRPLLYPSSTPICRSKKEKPKGNQK